MLIWFSLRNHSARMTAPSPRLRKSPRKFLVFDHIAQQTWTHPCLVFTLCTCTTVKLRSDVLAFFRRYPNSRAIDSPAQVRRLLTARFRIYFPFDFAFLSSALTVCCVACMQGMPFASHDSVPVPATEGLPEKPARAFPSVDSLRSVESVGSPSAAAKPHGYIASKARPQSRSGTVRRSL